jgi:ribonuclease-3 family protein
VEAAVKHPLTLAYIGDAVFSLFVREQLLLVGCEKVRELHEFCRTIVSAKLQAYAVRRLMTDFSESEQQIFLRGRNTSSAVPKSATVSEYRAATGFETLIGYLHLEAENDRKLKLMTGAFEIIFAKLKDDQEK